MINPAQLLPHPDPFETLHHSTTPPHAGVGSPFDHLASERMAEGMRRSSPTEVAPGTAIMAHAVPSFRLLEDVRPDMAEFARFAQRVETASFYMLVAFSEAGVRDFQPECRWDRMSARKTFDWGGWMADMILCRFDVLRSALRYAWTPPANVEMLTYAAFQSLCDLTPASGYHLKQMYFQRRPQAVEGLIKQLDLVSQLMEDALGFASEAEHALSDTASGEDAARLEAVQAEILGNAGALHSLSEAAEVLGMSRQNLHKRIGTGSALGVMRGKDLIVPSVQFQVRDGKTSIVSGLREVMRVFREAKAGDWSALQFLIDHDPGLNAVPLAALRDGKTDHVVAAARAYLGVDER